MKQSQLKSLLKHIITEIQSNEMIANKDEQPDDFGFVNVEESSRLFTSEANRAARAIFGNVVNISRISHPSSFGVWFAVTLADGKKELIRKDRTGKWWYEKGRDAHGKLIMAEIPAEKMSEQTGTGAVAGYSTSFAFKPKKKKTEEKTLPNGRYVDDMEDVIRMKRAEGLNEVSGTRYYAEIPVGAYFRIPGYDNLFQKIDNDTAKNHGTGGMLNKPVSAGRKGQKVKMPHDTMVNVMEEAMNEMTTSTAAGGQSGGMISVPTWGTKNKEGSPRAIAASKSLGYKPVKSISTKEKKI